MTQHQHTNILIDPAIHREVWLNIWSRHKFVDWTDAHSWLNERYNATASKRDRGFEIQFRDAETLTQFVLEWL